MVDPGAASMVEFEYDMTRWKDSFATEHVCGGHVMLFHNISYKFWRHIQERQQFWDGLCVFLLESSGYIFGTHIYIYIE